jgi:hypothetical protein
LSIGDNNALTNIDALSKITSVGEGIIISRNAALTNLNGLSNLISVGRSIAVTENSTLTNVDGLGKLTNVESLTIRGNDALTNVDGLGKLTNVESLTIRANDVLANLDGLNNINTIDVSLSIAMNDALTNLDGLSKLINVESLSIIYNNALTNLNGLIHLSTIRENLTLTNNNMLSACTCGLGPLLDAGGVMGTITLNNNLPGCNSVEEIQAGTCDTTIATEDDNADLPHRFTLEANYPNPFNPTTTLRFGLPQAQRVRLTVYDALGREVAVLLDQELSAGWHTATFEAGNLASGVYLARLQADNRVETQRMILLK